MTLYAPTAPELWQGRIDAEETRPALRWHQQIQHLDLNQIDTNTHGQLALLGFCCDAGIKRNKGRAGAAAGPAALRAGLANAACPDVAVLDAGNVTCVGDELEAAQLELAQRIQQLLALDAKPVILGGGHEIAWASFQGIRASEKHRQARLGIINFDAHFDLRAASPNGSSGTPFRQMSEWCEHHQQPFHYLVLGLNPSANTQALFDYAVEQGVQWVEDSALEAEDITQTLKVCDAFLANVDVLYLTVCLDVFCAAFAPGVSAPAALGISPARMLLVFKYLLNAARQQQKEIILLDIAELSPGFDQAGQTARLGARIIWEYQRFLHSHAASIG